MRTSLVLFSGGLDSFLSLQIALKDGGHVTPIFFNLGQNSFQTEKDNVERISKDFGLESVILDLTSLKPLLTCDYTLGFSVEEGEAYNSTIPNRNLLLITLAHNYAQVNGYTHIYHGIYHKDFNSRSRIVSRISPSFADEITPHLDQTEYFVDTLTELLTKTTEADEVVKIEHCLRNFDKVDIMAELAKIGQLEYALNETISCYSESSTYKQHAWGKGCGLCPSCIDRARAYNFLKL